MTFAVGFAAVAVVEGLAGFALPQNPFGKGSGSTRSSSEAAVSDFWFAFACVALPLATAASNDCFGGAERTEAPDVGVTYCRQSGHWIRV
jgi:hypothetical protein